jgi:hypothetical protein
MEGCGGSWGLGQEHRSEGLAEGSAGKLEEEGGQAAD